MSKVDLRTSPPTITGTASTLTGRDDVVSPDGRTVYYISLSGLYAADVTGTTPTLLSSVGFPVNGAVLHGITVSGQTLLVSYGDGQPNGLPYGVYAFSIANRVPTALGRGATQPFPVDVAATPDGNKIVTADGLGNTVSVLDAHTRASLATVALGSGDVGAVTVSPDSRYAYAIGHFYGIVSKIDLSTYQVVARSAELTSPLGGSIAVSPDGAYVYADFALDADADAFFVLSAANLSTVEPFHGLSYSPGIAVSGAGSTRGIAYILGSADTFGHFPASLQPLQQSPVGGGGGGSTTGRIGVVTGGQALVKEGGLGAGWVTEWTSIKQVVVTANRIGVVTNSGEAYVKEGGLAASWVHLRSGVRQIAVSPNRVGLVTNSGVAYALDGALTSAQVDEYHGVTQIAVTDSRIGVVTTGGIALVKEGSLGSSWVTERGATKQVALAANRIGIVTTSGEAYVKDGTLGAAWVLERGGVAQIALSPLRIGVVTTGGEAFVKEGALNASWVDEHAGVTRVFATDTRVGILTTGGVALVKEGPLGSSWVTEHPAATDLSLS